MRDFLPADVRRRTYVIDVVREVYERYGFEPLETPAVENLETLMGKYGEEGNQLIFPILKRGEQFTASLEQVKQGTGGAREGSGRSRAALRPDGAAGARRRGVSGAAAEVLQAVSDSAGVARRPAGARAVPGVLSV